MGDMVLGTHMQPGSDHTRFCMPTAVTLASVWLITTRRSLDGLMPLHPRERPFWFCEDCLKQVASLSILPQSLKRIQSLMNGQPQMELEVHMIWPLHKGETQYMW